MTDPKGKIVTLVAPTEPTTLKNAGRVSSTPEKFGADVLLIGSNGEGPVRVGVQRKTVSDFLASVEDNRLAKEVQQMRRLDMAFLVIEGSFRWGTDGKMPQNWGRQWTQAQVYGILWSMQAEGIMFGQVDNTTQFVAYVELLASWVSKPRHRFGDRRSKQKTELWGKMDSRDFGSWVLQGLPGLGPEIAERIWDHFNGMPFGWNVSQEEMLEIPGIGPKTVEKLWQIIKQA